MRTEQIKIYSFDELSNNSKEKVIEEFYDINVNFNWWNSTYEDANNSGIEITSFDLYRNDITGNLDSEIASELILSEHGESCNTYKISKEFLNKYNHHSNLVDKYDQKINEIQNNVWYVDLNDKDKRYIDLLTNYSDYHYGEMEYLSDEYKKDILDEYLNILTNEYEYLTSEEVIIETIKGNEYEFTEDGSMY